MRDRGIDRLIYRKKDRRFLREKHTQSDGERRYVEREQDTHTHR